MSEFLDRHAADVSRGGIFVRHGEVLAVGRPVKLNLQLADSSTLLAGDGTVFWTREADPTRAESEPGMGIRFTRLTAESQRMLSYLLAEKAERERQDDGTAFDEDERTVVATEEELRAAVGSGDNGDAAPAPRHSSGAVVAVALASVPAPTPLRRIITPPPMPPAAPPVLPSLADVVEMAAPSHRPHHTEASRIAADAESEPHVGSTGMSWESTSAPFLADYDLEQTDLTPKSNRRRGIGIGIGIALGGAVALGALCFTLLSTPVAKPLSALSSNVSASRMTIAATTKAGATNTGATNTGATSASVTNTGANASGSLSIVTTEPKAAAPRPVPVWTPAVGAPAPIPAAKPPSGTTAAGRPAEARKPIAPVPVPATATSTATAP